jgi:hypothetical protein
LPEIYPFPNTGKTPANTSQPAPEVDGIAHVHRRDRMLWQVVAIEEHVSMVLAGIRQGRRVLVGGKGREHAVALWA